MVRTWISSFLYRERWSPNIVNKTADEMAAMLEVVTLIMEVPAFSAVSAITTVTAI